MLHGEAMLLEASGHGSESCGKPVRRGADAVGMTGRPHEDVVAPRLGSIGQEIDFRLGNSFESIRRESEQEGLGSPCEPMVFPPSPTLLYDGTIEGYYTAVFRAFEHKLEPYDICTADCPRLSLFSETTTIETSDELAQRVDRGLARKLGADEAQRIRLAFLSDEPGHELELFHYIRLAMRKGRYAFCDHANPIVESYERLWRQVSNERHRMFQFTRFAEMEGGIYFAQINPNANVVPVMMEHFARRFNTQPFIIYDEVHKIAGVSRDGRWMLVPTDDITPPRKTEREEAYSAMWRSFYDSICNRERLNPALRRNFMPKRLWKNITEVQ
jgi:probable DNA metabolism protein